MLHLVSFCWVFMENSNCLAFSGVLWGVLEHCVARNKTMKNWNLLKMWVCAPFWSFLLFRCNNRVLQSYISACMAVLWHGIIYVILCIQFELYKYDIFRKCNMEWLNFSKKPTIMKFPIHKQIWANISTFPTFSSLRCDKNGNCAHY